MHEIDVGYNCSGQDFKRTHANGAEDSARQQGMVAVREVGPHGRDEEHQITQNHDGAAAEFDGESIGDEARDANGKDGPAQAAIQRIVRHVKLNRHLGEGRADHRTPSTNNGCVDADDQEQKTLLP